jgi:type IV conjugative transfer system coupling protein TraD
MTPSPLGDDFSRGFGLFGQQQRRWSAALLKLLVAMLLLWLAGIVGAVLLLHEPYRLQATVLWAWAWFLSDVLQAPELGTWPVRTSQGIERWPPIEIRQSAWFLETRNAVLGTFGQALLIGTALIVPLGLLLHRGLVRLGRRLRSTRHLRGQEIVSDRVLARRVRKAGRASDLLIGSVPLIRDDETAHTLLLGTTGAGKTQAILRLLDGIAARGEAAIIYDRTGTFTPLYLAADCGDVLLNPLDARSPAWSPWAEMRHAADADRLAAATIPRSPGRDEFFADAARALYAALLVHLWRRRDRSLEQLMRLMLLETVAARRMLLAGTEAAKFFEPEGERTARSIEMNMTTYTRALRFLPASSGGRQDVSIRELIATQARRPANGRRRPWLFFASRPTEHDSLRPLLTCWLDVAVASLMALPEERTRRIWIVLDELATLHALPSLARLLAEGRKYGAAAVLGLQSVSQLHDSYGERGGTALLDNVNTKAIFRLNDPKSAEWAADALGQAERDVVRESTRYDPGSEHLTGVQISSQRHLAHVVLPSEITSLPPLVCYLRLSGTWPIARTRLPDPRGAKRRAGAQAFVHVDPDRSVDAALRAQLAARPAGQVAGKAASAPEATPTGAAARSGVERDGAVPGTEPTLRSGSSRLPRHAWLDGDAAHASPEILTSTDTERPSGSAGNAGEPPPAVR